MTVVLLFFQHIAAAKVATQAFDEASLVFVGAGWVLINLWMAGRTLQHYAMAWQHLMNASVS